MTEVLNSRRTFLKTAALGGYTFDKTGEIILV